MVGTGRGVGVMEEPPVFWQSEADVAAAFNLSITVAGLGADN